MGRHNTRTWWWRRPQSVSRRPRMVDLVDAASLLMHRITPDALAAGQSDARCGYIALCGDAVVPAALVEPGNGRRCGSCERVLEVRTSYAASEGKPR